jgi:hypothetical protein
LREGDAIDLSRASKLNPLREVLSHESDIARLRESSVANFGVTLRETVSKTTRTARTPRH